jgi:hypothetical protein
MARVETVPAPPKQAADAAVKHAFIGIGVCSLSVDGNVEAAMTRTLARHLAGLRSFKEASLDELQFTANRFARIGDEGGLQRLLEVSARAVPKPLRETAFAFAADLLAIEKHLGPLELQFLERLRILVKVSPMSGARIIEGAQIRARF